MASLKRSLQNCIQSIFNARSNHHKTYTQLILSAWFMYFLNKSSQRLRIFFPFLSELQSTFTRAEQVKQCQRVEGTRETQNKNMCLPPRGGTSLKRKLFHQLLLPQILGSGTPRQRQEWAQWFFRPQQRKLSCYLPPTESETSRPQLALLMARLESTTYLRVTPKKEAWVAGGCEETSLSISPHPPLQGVREHKSSVWHHTLPVGSF